MVGVGDEACDTSEDGEGVDLKVRRCVRDVFLIHRTKIDASFLGEN